ncbi:MAG: prolyl oligopeptidase family serine peptidase [Gemmatimonadales bacterium]
MRQSGLGTLLSALALALGSAPLAAQAPGLEPADLFQLEYAADPQISPDGQWIVYTRRFSDLMTDRRHSNLWLLKSDGSAHRPITSGKQNDGSARWSPDGGRIAFVSSRDGSPQIYVYWVATGTVQPVSNLTEPPSGIEWSPDGKWLAFYKLVPKPKLVVGRPVAAPAGAKWAPPPKYTDRLVFRFDQVGELPTGFTHVFVVPSEGGTARQVTSGDFHHGSSPFGGGPLAWSPDGTELVLPARRIADAEMKWRETELYAVSVADGSIRQLTRRVGPDSDPAVSPDGRLIAYTGYDDRQQGYQNALLYVMGRDGSGARVVSAKLDRSVSGPTWSADGRAIYVQFDEEGNTKVARFGLDGSWQVVAEDLGGTGSAYGGGSYTVARDGRIAFSYSRPEVPSEVAVTTPAQGGKAQALTSLNDDLLAGRTLGQVEELWYPSSKDGRRIQGWIVKPPGFDPARKYPLILEIHGGPFANYGDRFDEEKQLMASAGYVVLYTNPRGSTSYGEEFGNLIHHAYPGDDFFDLNSGVDAVIAKGYVDANNLFVTGGSGGGVLTAWMIGHTDRFKAALAFYPVINWESFSLTADMAPSSVANWFPGFPWDHRDNYDQRSLLSVVKNVKTPTLIMTGEEDYRTPMSESEQYYKALKMLGVPAVLVRVPEEPHGIRRRPSHEAAKLTTLQGWFEKYRGQMP